MTTTLQPAAILEVSAQLEAVLQHAVVAPLDDTGWIRVTGSDRVRWLNGMVTNSIASLAPGEGCYNFVLNAQGRIQGDLTAFLLEDSILLETDREQVPALLAHFDRFIIMDDVELASVTNESLPVSNQNLDWTGLLVVGPDAGKLLQLIGISLEQSSVLTFQSTTWNKNPLDVIRAHSPIVPCFELWSDLTSILQLGNALNAAGATSVAAAALEQLRILEGRPRYGTDIRNTESAKDLPQETAPIGVQSHALHFSKGCYLGQEIVERIHSRGNVHRTFSGFELTGTLPAAGTALHAEGKPVGELTSVTAINLPSGQVQLALGYIRREALDRNLPLEYPGGTAAPIKLPYEGIS
jgi:folate-binding protein YgfZ